MRYKVVLHVVPWQRLEPCRECGCTKPVLVKIKPDDKTACWKVLCPVCGNQTLLNGTGPVSTGDESAIHEWNHEAETPDRMWYCPSCKAWNFGKYYKFCPYCGKERKQ